MSETFELTAEDREYIEKICDAIKNRDKDALKSFPIFKESNDARLEEYLNTAPEMVAKVLERTILIFYKTAAMVNINCDLPGM